MHSNPTPTGESPPSIDGQPLGPHQARYAARLPSDALAAHPAVEYAVAGAHNRYHAARVTPTTVRVAIGKHDSLPASTETDTGPNTETDAETDAETHADIDAGVGPNTDTETGSDADALPAIVSTLDSLARDHSLPGTTVETTVVSPRCGAETDRRAITPTGRDTHDIEFTYWMHPLTPAVDRALADCDSHVVDDYHIDWPQSATPLRDGFCDWRGAAPLEVDVTFVKPVAKFDGDDVDPHRHALTSIRNAVTDTGPYDPDALVIAERDTTQTGHFIVDVCGRPRQASEHSGVHHAPATTLPEFLPPSAATENPPISTATASGQSAASDTSTTPQQTMLDGFVTADTAPGVGPTSDAGADSPAYVTADIQLTVTSPPYGSVIDYGDVGNGNWTDTHTADDGDDWLSEQRAIMETIYQHTREGGFCAVVISPVAFDDHQALAPLPARYTAMMRDIGWHLHHQLYWDKTQSRGGQFRTTVQHPTPTYYHPNAQVEQIQVWRRGEPVNRPDPAGEFELSDAMVDEIANNIWHICPVSPTRADITHPAPFPEELAHRLITLYAPTGSVVCDPMAGSGTTLKVADRLGRIGIGTELQPAFVGEARARLTQRPYERDPVKLPAYETTDAPTDPTTTNALPAGADTSTDGRDPGQPDTDTDTPADGRSVDSH